VANVIVGDCDCGEARFDVVVVGAGPGGCFAAYRLARAGARVAIVDGSHPREKPCGGGVTGRAIALAGDAIDVARLPGVSIDRATFRDSTGRTVDVPLGQPGCGAPDAQPALVVASRTEFDAQLLAAALAAGASLIAARALDVERTAGAMRVATSHGRLSAPWIVGADGANSLVRRRVARAFPRSELSIATGFFARGVTSTSIVLEMTATPPGYIWSFPRRDHLAIGVCAQADAGATAADLRAIAREWIRASGIAPGATLVPYSWPIPSLSARGVHDAPLSGPGWCLVGDAAGLVDPITREGIFFALESAKFAASALTGAREPDRAYREAVARSGTLDELRRAARLKAGFFRPRFTGLLLDALERSEPVRGIMADLIAGTQSYRRLKWRLASTLEFGLAWRALAG
jgi:geranylgeranyl reductase family protein